MLPDTSWVKIPVAATWPTAGMDPVVVNPNLPAIEAVEQAAWRPGTTPKIDHIINARILVLFMELLLLNANLLFSCWQVRIFRIPIQEEFSRWCYAINVARAQSRASLLFRSSRSPNYAEVDTLAVLG